MAELNEIAVEKFREYLRIDTTTAHADYYAVGDFLRKYATELECKFTAHEINKGKPIYILTFEARDEAAKARKSILLNSHMDVVPAYPESWTHPPFSANMTPDGRIYARGSQDMKCVGIWYLEAIRRLQAAQGAGKFSFSRTVHVVFVPDEETGGAEGMRDFVKTPEFAALNVGFALDEGMANIDEHLNSIAIYHSERYVFWNRLLLEGTTGHGSQFLPSTVGEKLSRLLNAVYAYREQQRSRVGTLEPNSETGEPTRVGESDVPCVNVTMLSGGVAHNVVPSNVLVTLDIRMPPDVPPQDARAILDRWCTEAAGASPGSVRIDWLVDTLEVPSEFRRIRRSSAYCAAVERACTEIGCSFDWQTFPGATDSRFLRASRVHTISVSPLAGVPRLLHCHDEFVTRDVFLRGVRFYELLLPAIADINED